MLYERIRQKNIEALLALSVGQDVICARASSQSAREAAARVARTGGDNGQSSHALPGKFGKALLELQHFCETERRR